MTFSTDANELARLALSGLCLISAMICAGALFFFDDRMMFWRRISLGLLGAGLLMRAFGVVIAGEPLLTPALLATGILSHLLFSYKPWRWLHMPPKWDSLHWPQSR